MNETTDDNRKMDLLYSAAVKYGKLLTIGYHIVLGRKGKEYHIQLRFPYDSFFSFDWFTAFDRFNISF